MRTRLVSIAATVVVSASVAHAQSAPSASAPPSSAARLQEAQRAMGARDFATAATVLREVVAAEPANARAWNMLGVALRRDGKWTEAVPAHRKAAEVPGSRPAALYQLGLSFAAGQQLDSAFHWLLEAKRTGRVNMVSIVQDPLGPGLTSDKRFASLMPSAAEFRDPFVEPAKIIHEWRGEAAGDQFGWIARNIGDVDGDRVADLVTSAPTSAQAGQNAGKVYVYSGKTGAMLWSATGEPGGQLGIGVEAAGDFNGDGTSDVAAGAPFLDRVYVYHGRSGAVLRVLQGEAQGSAFGRRVAAAGDVNGDGYGDLLVSAPLHNGPAGAGAGRVYVFSGRDGSRLFVADGEGAGDGLGNSLAGKTVSGESWIITGAGAGGANNAGRVYVYRKLDAKPAFTIDPDPTSAGLGGMFVSVIGDVNADGVPDVYGSDFGNAAKGPSTGRIFVNSGKDGRNILTLTGEAAGDGFGIGPADAGDVDGDRHDDLIVGAWQHSSAAPSGGKVYLYSGKTGSLLRAWTGKVMGETFGFDATGIGDVDGDGTIDFLLTSAWSAIEGPQSGRMYIVSGAKTDGR
ncbi:MAG TPA: FG-GAP-like repeat-containing protein [Gemmatimonadaceae bacterium]|nr:FG-GAP-like repeat-containing protein [Gemmatimonadaceae bacterium]